MLSFLTKSVLRRKIILLFVYNQRKEFYLSEIARQIRTSPGTAQRELNKLLAADLVSFKKKGNLNFYRLNAGYALLKEVTSIVRKTIGIEVALKTELGRVGGISFAFIFGSYAKEDMRSDSDIDLYIVGRPKEDDVGRAVKKVEDTVGREINYRIADEAEFARKASTASFIKDIISKPVMILGKADDLTASLMKRSAIRRCCRRCQELTEPDKVC
jgi:predicted nucleotidyltransferase